MTSRPPEFTNPACATQTAVHPDQWTPHTGTRRVPPTVAAVCRDCQSRIECLTYAIDDTTVTGIWGGHLFQGGRHGRVTRDALSTLTLNDPHITAHR